MNKYDDEFEDGEDFLVDLPKDSKADYDFDYRADSAKKLANSSCNS